MQNFYEHQEVAKSNSASLIVAMCLAIVGTILISGAILTASMFGPWYYLYRYGEATQYYSRPSMVRTYYSTSRDRPKYVDMKRGEEFPWALLLFWYGTLTTATGAAVGTVTYSKVKAIRKGGGASVAEKLGGVRLSGEDAHDRPYTIDQDCKRALNIVEEMAIAARLPTPQVYMLSGQDGINAFAVGYTKEDAVLGLTEGAVRKLSREQLQGVIAHEFAHIFNGDMRLNLQMIGYMHGVLAIAIAATWIIQVGSELMQTGGHGHGRGNGLGLGLFLTLVGSMLWPVGMVGNLFASIIKAAFSRQREFLADAYAVEFTRNAEGVAGALKRIAGHGRGSVVRHAHAVECSHLFFANGYRGFFNLFKSHPPIELRILRIDPLWDGTPYFDECRVDEFSGAFEETMNFIGGSMSDGGRDIGTSEEIIDTRLETFDSANQAAMEHAAEVQATIPGVLCELSQESPGAEVELLALWLSADPAGQHDHQRVAKLEEPMRAPVLALVEVLRALGPAERLVLLDTAVRTLARIDEGAFADFVKSCQRLDMAGNTHDPYRWALRQMVQQVKRQRTEEQVKPRINSIEPTLGACEVMLSMLAHVAAHGPMAEFSLQRAIPQLGHELTLRDEEDCTLETLDAALEQLAELSPRCRRDVLLACGAVVSTDQDVDEAEACLLRGICGALGFPPVSLLPGQPVAPGA